MPHIRQCVKCVMHKGVEKGRNNRLTCRTEAKEVRRIQISMAEAGELCIYNTYLYMYVSLLFIIFGSHNRRGKKADKKMQSKFKA